VIANATGVDDDAAWDDLVGSGRHVVFRVSRSGDAIRLEPTGSGVDVLIGRMIDAVLAARNDGSWPRLKACRNCHWVVFDPSKNRSSRWCSMTACGGRHNAREYRRRNRSAH
jgi:predicted RNA-binding Zn ribbon-like protein